MRLLWRSICGDDRCGNLDARNNRGSGQPPNVVLSLCSVAKMVNGTTGTLLDSFLPPQILEPLTKLPNPTGSQIDSYLDPWYSVADGLSGLIGEAPAGIFLMFWIFKIFNLSQAILFDVLEYYGWLDVG